MSKSFSKYSEKAVDTSTMPKAMVKIATVQPVDVKGRGGGGEPHLSGETNSKPWNVIVASKAMAAPRTSSKTTWTKNGAASTYSKAPTVQMCPICNAPHRLETCPKFLVMKPVDRAGYCREKILCFNCLIPNHTASRC